MSGCIGTSLTFWRSASGCGPSSSPWVPASSGRCSSVRAAKDANLVFPSWFQPWSWRDYSVYPEAKIAAVVALIPATLFVALVVTRRQWPAAAALLSSVVLSSYAYFGGLTFEGRVLFGWGPFLGLAALGLINLAHDRKPYAGGENPQRAA
jgi:hypothetical protein